MRHGRSCHGRPALIVTPSSSCCLKFVVPGAGCVGSVHRLGLAGLWAGVHTILAKTSGEYRRASAAISASRGASNPSQLGDTGLSTGAKLRCPRPLTSRRCLRRLRCLRGHSPHGPGEQGAAPPEAPQPPTSRPPRRGGSFGDHWHLSATARSPPWCRSFPLLCPCGLLLLLRVPP